MNSWFDIYPMRQRIEVVKDLYDRYDQKSLLKSVNIVSKLVDHEVDRLNGKSEKVIIGGFS